MSSIADAQKAQGSAPADAADPIGKRRLLSFLLPPAVAMYATFQGIQQILIPAQVAALDPAQKVANLALLTALSSVTAVLGLLSGGALSDRTRGRWGRRAPWLALTGAVSAGLLVAMGRLDSLTAIAIGYCLLWFTMNFYQAALTAVLPDRVPERLRGVASSVLGLGVPLGIMTGVNVAARVSQQAGYAVLAGLVVLTTAAFLVFAREPANWAAPPRAEHAPLGPTDRLRRVAGFFASFRSRDFSLAFVSRAFMFFAQFTISGYMYYILQDHIGAQNLPGHDPKVAVSILGTINTGVWIVSVIVAGWAADRLNRRKLFVGLCSIGLAMAMLVPLLSPTWTGILIFKILGGIFFGTYMAVDLALMSLVLPDKNAEGRDMAVLAVATAGPQILAPVIAAALIGLGGYEQLFIFGGVMALGGGMLVLLIKSVR
ncbi:MAG TPA: MFS transporter [Phenylobacterium sp.]